MTEETFTRELERRAEHVHGAPLTFDDVRGKARSIRRRRQGLASAAAAAVIAAVIVIPMALGGGGDRTPQPAPSPTPTPAPSPSVALPTVPGSSVLHDGTLQRPDGSQVPTEIDGTDLQQFGVLTDGRVVVPVPGVRKIRVYGADGTLDTEYDVDLNVIAMSADDTLVAWIDPDYRVVVLESGKAEPTTFDWGVPMPGESYGSIDGLYGSDCAHGGCTLLVGDFNTTTHVLTKVEDPAVELETSEPLRVAAVSPDGTRWAVTYAADQDPQFGCSGIYDPTARTMLARSCEATPWSFSPDGQLLVSARGDNQMWGSIEVLDQDLELVTSYRPPAGTAVTDWGWQDPQHLLVVTSSLDGPPTWSLVRVGVDDGAAQPLMPDQDSGFVISE